MAEQQYVASKKIHSWGITKATVHIDTIEHEGKRYKCETKVFTGRFGKRAAKAISEIGANRLYLSNTETHIAWIEHAAKYVKDYGLMRMGEVIFTPII